MPGGPASRPPPWPTSAVRNAVYDGPIDLPTGSLVAGKNRLSVEVHQDAPDQQRYRLWRGAHRRDASSTPPSDPAAHRGAGRGVGGTLQQGERGSRSDRLVARWRDRFRFSARHEDSGGRLPRGGEGRRCAGRQVSGSGAARSSAISATGLNNGSDLIRLEDAVENPVDEVRYCRGRALAGTGGRQRVESRIARSATPTTANPQPGRPATRAPSRAGRPSPTATPAGRVTD